MAKRVTSLKGSTNGKAPRLDIAPLVIEGSRVKLRSRVAGQIVKLPDDLPLPQIERRRSGVHGWGVFRGRAYPEEQADN